MSNLSKEIFKKILTNRSKKLPPGKNLPKYDEIISMNKEVSTALSQDPILLELEGKFVVCGDIHGDVDDLIRVFEMKGCPPKTKYIFMGDYIDRGNYSIEVLMILFSLKVMYKNSIYLLRGNHECDSMATGYGFKNDCFRKLNRACYKSFLEVFHNLPVAAILGKKIMCVHGGITKSINSIYDLKKFKKSYDIPMKGAIADLLWSDPDASVESTFPSPRGVGCIFGVKELNNFLQKNKLEMIVRSHESCDNGYDYPFPNSKKLITIFTVCDYCDESNKGAILDITEDQKYSIIEINMLSKKQLKKRRVIFPDWLIETKKPMKEIESDDVVNNDIVKMRLKEEDVLISV